MNEQKWFMKWIPLWTVLVFLLLVGALFLVYQHNLNPEVIKEQATLTEKSAVVWQAQKNFFEGLPSILISVTFLVLGVFAGLGVFSLLLGLAAASFGSTFTKMSQNSGGMIIGHRNGTESKIYLAPPNSLVAARLNERYGRARVDNSIPAGVTRTTSTELLNRSGGFRDFPGISTSESHHGSEGDLSGRRPGSIDSGPTNSELVPPGKPTVSELRASAETISQPAKDNHA